MAIVSEDATEYPPAAVLADARAHDDAPARPEGTATSAGIDIVPAWKGSARRLRSRPRPRTGNSVSESDVAAMFDEIAPVYDRLNTVMTLGADRRWRDAAVAATGVGEGGSAIDVACGTGKLAAALAERVGPFGRVLGVDLSPAMIALASETHRDVVQLEFVAGECARPAGRRSGVRRCDDRVRPAEPPGLRGRVPGVAARRPSRRRCRLPRAHRTATACLGAPSTAARSGACHPCWAGWPATGTPIATSRLPSRAFPGRATSR